ncbi:glucan biosynthesis protein [Methylophaga sp.]|uniref:glucan biosynthesis protein n=1 Tax=Methylophaga sp. TaxID=2024840 RepID=UPI00140061C7|nr:glucan biosynthesis protein D [Methylophaga sp.]MTI63895.1 glucan biosynthesis protein D [Methylophaga sp.]
MNYPANPTLNHDSPKHGHSLNPAEKRHRRLQWIALIFSVFVLFSLRAEAEDQILAPSGEPFSYAWLKGYAKSLAEKPYQDQQNELPESLRGMDWDEYQQIQFNRDSALWREDDLAFRTELFHLGLYFEKPVQVYELDEGVVTRVEYSPSMFNYGKSDINSEALPADLGFAGFRMQFQNDWKRDFISFLGASYFRAVGKEMQYGLSARGLAIDTALAEAEEFPMFTHFWLQKPQPGSDKVIVYALLDSPSVSGAYRFEIQPGGVLKNRVDAAIYPRTPIERLGIAPLTSMYMIGENSRRANWDWRPEIHDSDGLFMHTGGDEWIWRPLVNPRQLRFNSFSDNNPKGFGLMQRDRDFDHYQDDGVFYNLRPSLWIEPLNDWGKGAVQLAEIPTLDETFDNIVAFWNPAKPVEPGEELLYSYNMYWGSNLPTKAELAKVVDTFTGLGGVIGKKREYYSKRFVIDFAGGRLSMLAEDAEVEAVISSSDGRVEITSARPQNAIEGYRIMFDLVPPENSTQPIDLRAHLVVNGQPLTETWVYQWTPPPQAERKLHNAGHLK